MQIIPRRRQGHDQYLKGRIRTAAVLLIWGGTGFFELHAPEFIINARREMIISQVAKVNLSENSIPNEEK